MLDPNNLGQNNLWKQTIFGWKKLYKNLVWNKLFCTKKFLGPKKFVVLEKFWIKKI